MAKHRIAFGHGGGDTGTTYGSRTEAAAVRKLKPYLEKWGKQSKDTFSFYDGNLFRDRAINKQTGYDTLTELHLDGPKGSGGHVIINSSYKPDAIDKRLRDVIKKNFGIVGYLQKNNGFSYRKDLYNLNMAKTYGINYRLLEMFFLSNEADYNHYVKNLDQIAKEIVEAITNTKLSGDAKPVTPQSKPSKPAPATPAPSGGGSIVDYLTKQKRPSSFSARKKLAEQYGITNYKGTARQNTDLLNKLRSNATPSKPGKTINQMADEVDKGLHGTGHANRRKSLNISEAEYAKVRAEVNRRHGIKATPSKPSGTAKVRPGQTVRTRALYASENSTKNVRSSSISGYVADINNARRNPIRLRNKKGGYYLGFTRQQDLI